MTRFAAVVVAAALGGTPAHAASDEPQFGGEKTSYLESLSGGGSGRSHR
jgi:hypothetical protein